MKKLALSVALIGALAFGATAADAASIKATGAWQIDATWSHNAGDFQDAGKDNNFDVSQRIRTAFQFIANENLKGVLETQIGTNSWGNGEYQIGAGRTANGIGAGGSQGIGNGNLILRKAYLDFKVPNTKVNILAGYQSLALPSAFGAGSAILDDHVAGIAAVVPVTDGISLVGGYARPYSANTAGTSASTNVFGNQVNGNAAVDAAFLYANLDFTGVKVQPFFAMAYAGQDAVNTYAMNMVPPVSNSAFKPLGLFAPQAAGATRAYWGGAAVTVTALDPFKIMADLNYGYAAISGNDNVAYAGLKSGSGTRAGWLGDIAVDYTGLSFMTPELFYAYSSGQGGDLTNSGRMPVVSGENWAYGTFWMQGGDSLIANNTTPSQNLGFWALGLSLKDIKIIDKLTHTVHFIYFKGTNDENIVNTLPAAAGVTTGSYGQFLTKQDHLFEIDLNSKYQLYDELSLGLELGYINAHFDKDVWHNKLGANSVDTNMISNNAYKAALMMQYSF